MRARASAAAPLEVRNRGVLAETLWQENRASHGDEVLDLLADAVRREPGYDWAWNVLDHYARVLEKPGRCEAAARLLTTTRPGEARSWFRLAQSLDTDTSPGRAESLAALTRALALNPRLTDAHDVRACLLTEAGRYDEALAACEPPADAYPGGTRPFTLDGRAAWVLARRGDLTAARERLREVLADHPGYEWGWRMLADWAEAAKDYKEALTAAERLAFLSPHAAQPLGYLAAARLRLKQRDGAKSALQEAMRRDPTYLYAPASLLNLQLEDKEFPGAEETVGFLGRHFPGPPTLGRTVLLAVRRRQMPRAEAALSELAQTRPAPDTDDGDLHGAMRAVLEARWPEVVENALQPALRAPLTANPDAGAVWVHSRADRARWDGVGKTVSRLPEGELARRARMAYLTVLTERRRGWNVWWFTRRAREALRADTESWGQVGYALTGCNFHRRAVNWLSDWAARPDAKGWMLLNLASCLRTLQRHDEAVKVHRHALTLPPDHSRPKHLLWAALEDALADDEAAHHRAGRLHEEIASRIEGLAQPFRYLGVLLEQTLAVRAPRTPEERRAAYRAAGQTLRDERRAVAATFRQSNPGTYRAERRVRRRLARDADLPWQRFLLALFSPPISPVAQWLFVVAWIVALAAIFSVAAAVLVVTTSNG